MLEKAKMAACGIAVSDIRDGMVVGLGTGSTVKYAILEIGKMCREGLSVTGIPTSKATERLAAEQGIPLAALEDVEGIHLTIDGADEVSPDFQLTKGMGGALTREKIIAQASDAVHIVVDGSKLVRRLGTRSPLPVEVVNGYEDHLLKVLEKGTGARGEIRTRRGRRFLTDNGNPIVDLSFNGIHDPWVLDRELSCVAGVVEHGLFLDIATRVFVGDRDGSSRELDLQ